MGPNPHGPRSVSCETELLDTQVSLRGPWNVGPTVGDFLEVNSSWLPEDVNNITHRIHVWYIYLHLPYFTIKNNQM